ncbi:MAG TPA: hypothetical protein VGA56_03380 [Opitutaceae bacterium]
MGCGIVLDSAPRTNGSETAAVAPAAIVLSAARRVSFGVMRSTMHAWVDESSREVTGDLQIANRMEKM